MDASANRQTNEGSKGNSKVFVPPLRLVQLTSITDVARSQPVTWTYSDVIIDIPISLAYMHGGALRKVWVVRRGVSREEGAA